MEDIYISAPREVPLDDLLVPQMPQQPQEPQEPEHREPKRKKKRKPIRRLFKTLIVILLIIIIGVSVIAGASGYKHENLKSNKYVSGFTLKRNPLVTNILLMGVDGSAEGTVRSDSMILMSLDYVHGKIKLTSFLRDCWVEIPSKESYAKLNAAFAYGGSQLACDTIEYNFGVDIDHYVMVDFEMFKEIVDKLGGIEVEVTKNEASFINKTTRQTVSSGERINLNGEEALVYCRIRKLDSDYMRTYRQRKVISAIIDKAKHTDPVSLISAVREVLPLIQTDLNPVEISVTALKGGIAALGFDIVQKQMPDDSLMTTGYAGSQWVEKPDIEACREALYEFIYKQSDEEE